MEPTAAQRAAFDKITAEIAAAPAPPCPAPSPSAPTPAASRTAAATPTRPGSTAHAEWTRKIGGTTVTRRLTPRELAEYQPLFDNAKKLRALLSELQDLTLEIVQADSTQER